MGTLLFAGLLAAGSFSPAAPVTPRESFHASANRLAREIALEAPPASQSRWRDWNAVRDLKIGSRVRVTLRTGVFKEGLLAAVEDDRIVVISPSNARMVMARADIAEVSRPMKHSVLGGLAGGAAGGLLGIYSAVNLGFKQCGSTCKDEGVMIIGSLIGMPIAGAYGGSRLAALGRWTTIYRG
jgi:hypothetical protein